MNESDFQYFELFHFELINFISKLSPPPEFAMSLEFHNITFTSQKMPLTLQSGKEATIGSTGEIFPHINLRKKIEELFL